MQWITLARHGAQNGGDHGSLPCSSRSWTYLKLPGRVITNNEKDLDAFHSSFLPASHTSPPLFKTPYPKKKGSKSSDKIPQLSPLRPNVLQKLLSTSPPPMVPTLPTLQCVFSPFSSLSLAALGLHFDPAAQTKSCRIPISQQGLKFRPDPAGENPERPVINSSHLEKLSWLFLVRKFYIVPKFPRWKSAIRKSCCFFFRKSPWCVVCPSGEKKGAFTMLKIVLEVWGDDKTNHPLSSVSPAFCRSMNFLRKKLSPLTILIPSKPLYV